MTSPDPPLPTPPDDVTNSRAKYLWIPYTLICLIFITLMLASFLHYHYRKRGKCRHTNMSEVCEPDGCCWCFSDCYQWSSDRRLKFKRHSNKRIEVSTVEVRPCISISMAHSAFAQKDQGPKPYQSSSHVPMFGRQSSGRSEDRSPKHNMNCDAFGQSYG